MNDPGRFDWLAYAIGAVFLLLGLCLIAWAYLAP